MNFYIFLVKDFNQMDKPVNVFTQTHLKLFCWLSQIPSFKHESGPQKFLTSVVVKTALVLVLLEVVGGVCVVLVVLVVVGITIVDNILELRVVVGAVDN